MNTMLDFLKALVEKLRVVLVLASLAIAILLFKWLAFDVWWTVFAFCVAYIALLAIEKGVNAIKKKCELKKQAIVKSAKAKQEEDDFNEEVWKRFYALDAQTLGLVKTIFLAETDPGNPLIHYLHDGGTLAYEIDRSYDFRIPASDRVYYPLLHAERLNNTSVITFQPYYYELVAHYVETGLKERV